MIRDYIKKLVIEGLAVLGEDYPTHFNMDDFKKLNSFRSRMEYCEQHLTRISSGSGRIVYDIDGIKVLKLAKNEKGVSQNEFEAEQSMYEDLKYLVAKVFDVDDRYLWIEMEKALRVNKPIFKRVTGFNFDDFSKAISQHYDRANGKTVHDISVPDDVVAAMWEHEFCYDILNYLGNYDVPVGDLRRLSSYGLVKRNGEDTIVLIDYGISNEIYSTHYSK